VTDVQNLAFSRWGVVKVQTSTPGLYSGDSLCCLFLVTTRILCYRACSLPKRVLRSRRYPHQLTAWIRLSIQRYSSWYHSPPPPCHPLAGPYSSSQMQTDLRWLFCVAYFLRAVGLLDREQRRELITTPTRPPKLPCLARGLNGHILTHKETLRSR
jgi:hypothetical protein